MKPLVITALYDIGRSDWKDFSMSYHTYLHWMQKALNLRSHMVVFTEPKFEDKIREMRSNVDPTGEMTTYVINTLQDLEVYKKWNDGICEVMQDEVFLNKRHWDHVPEMNHPLYNIVMFNKIFFLNEALKLHTDATHLIWVDAGGIREDMDYPATWPNLAKLSLNKIMHFSHNIPFTVGDPEWHTLSQVRNIQGGAFVCPSHMIDWYMNEINKTIKYCLDNKFIGSDEKIFDLTYLRDPDKFQLIKQGWREYYSWLGT
jgi:hypothetical protein